jgi:hypothetical protein
MTGMELLIWIKLSDKLILDFGIDVRTYTGYHFRNINDRLARADGYKDDRDINNRNRVYIKLMMLLLTWTHLQILKVKRKLNITIMVM